MVYIYNWMVLLYIALIAGWYIWYSMVTFTINIPQMLAYIYYIPYI